MKRDLILDFDPIKDGTWNVSPFHSDYVPPQRKSSPIDPYELMPVYRAFDADPAAPLPKPKTRAVTGLDDFGEGPLDMYDLVHKTSDFGLTQSIGEEFNLADPPHRKRIRDNVANAQDWWQAANEGQIKDQNYAANFAKAARSARDSDDDHAGFGSVQSTALKHSVKPMELHNYLNGALEQQQAIIAEMNNRIMPWAPGTPLVQLPEVVPMPEIITEPITGFAPLDDGNAFGADDSLTDLWADNSDAGPGDPNAWRPGMLQPVATGELNSPERQDEQSGGVDAYKWHVEDLDSSEAEADDAAGYRVVGDLDKWSEENDLLGEDGRTFLAAFEIGANTDRAIDVAKADKHFDYDPVRLRSLATGIGLKRSVAEAMSIFEASEADARTLVRQHNIRRSSDGEIPADALRHLVASIRLAQRFGAAQAKDLGDLIELGLVRVVRSGNPKNFRNPPGGRLMDLYNNKLGRELALMPGNKGRGALEIAMEAYRQGKIRLKPFKTKP